MNFVLPSENLALGQATMQKDLYEFGVPGLAVDGGMTMRWSEGSCTHTTDTDEPWWTVDLGASYHVNKVALTNRVECCGKWCFKQQSIFKKLLPGTKQPETYDA